MTIGAGLSSYIPTANTKLYLKLNGNTNDSSGLGNNGTPTSISYNNGLFGQDASFNGSSSFIAIGAALNSVFNQSSWTVSLWSNATVGVGTYGSKYIANDNNVGVRQFSLSLMPNGTVYFEAYSSPNVFLYSTQVVPTGWYNIITTYNGTNITVMVNSIQFINASMNQLPTTTNGTDIGRRQYPGFEGYFPGDIDEIIVENTAWTAKQIATYYNQAIGKFSIV